MPTGLPTTPGVFLVDDVQVLEPLHERRRGEFLAEPWVRPAIGSELRFAGERWRVVGVRTEAGSDHVEITCEGEQEYFHRRIDEPFSQRAGNRLTLDAALRILCGRSCRAWAWTSAALEAACSSRPPRLLEFYNADLGRPLLGSPWYLPSQAPASEVSDYSISVRRTEYRTACRRFGIDEVYCAEPIPPSSLLEAFYRRLMRDIAHNLGIPERPALVPVPVPGWKDDLSSGRSLLGGRRAPL